MAEAVATTLLRWLAYVLPKLLAYTALSLANAKEAQPEQQAGAEELSCKLLQRAATIFKQHGSGHFEVLGAFADALDGPGDFSWASGQLAKALGLPDTLPELVEGLSTDLEAGTLPAVDIVLGRAEASRRFMRVLCHHLPEQQASAVQRRLLESVALSSCNVLSNCIALVPGVLPQAAESSWSFCRKTMPAVCRCASGADPDLVNSQAAEVLALQALESLVESCPDEEVSALLQNFRDTFGPLLRGRGQSSAGERASRGAATCWASATAALLRRRGTCSEQAGSFLEALLLALDEEAPVGPYVPEAFRVLAPVKVDSSKPGRDALPPIALQQLSRTVLPSLVSRAKALGGAAWTRRAALESAVALLASLSVEVACGDCSDDLRWCALTGLKRLKESAAAANAEQERAASHDISATKQKLLSRLPSLQFMSCSFWYVLSSGKNPGWRSVRCVSFAALTASLWQLSSEIFASITLAQLLPAGWTAAKVVELTPQGTAAVANAWAKVAFRDESLFAALGSAIGRNLSSFKAQHVANLLNAYAKLQLKDAEVLGQLALQIPSRARDLVPMELSQSLHALVKLGIASENRKALFCLAEAVEERASEFHSRQLAVSMHAFSMLSTNHGKMFQSLAPQVLATLGMADDQSVAMLFCAYARSGQVHEQVIRGLMDKLLDAIPNSEQQTQVQLFYACGRLALHKEPLARVLAGSLRGKVPRLSSQHVANCLLTISRLSLASEEFAALLAALQARLLRKDVNFEVQQLANSFHAIAGIHGDGAPVQLYPAPLPAPVLQILIDQVEKSGPSWAEHPQLMVSMCHMNMADLEEPVTCAFYHLVCIPGMANAPVGATNGRARLKSGLSSPAKLKLNRSWWLAFTKRPDISAGLDPHETMRLQDAEEMLEQLGASTEGFQEYLKARVHGAEAQTQVQETERPNHCRLEEQEKDRWEEGRAQSDNSN
ncbi:unnamed protein product [Symbiodinium sp. CCMP2456]|nr:unnamed protein product [Symbiodinium sp. CCMP2456]